MQYQLLGKLDNEPSKLYFNKMDGLYDVALEHNGEPRNLEQPPPLNPFPGSPHSIGDYFYSGASLENVKRITPCANGTTLIGILLEYADGTRAALGEVKLDCLMDLIDIDGSSRIWMRTIGPLQDFLRGSNYNGQTLFNEIEFTEPSTPGYQAFEWRGSMGWWFQSDLRYLKLTQEDSTA